MQISLETSFVALSLSAVVALRAAFDNSTSIAEQQKLLQAAASVLDRTMPFPDLKAKLVKERERQVEVLVEERVRIAAVPQGLWHPLKVALSDLPSRHAVGLKSLEHALKRDFSRPDLLWPRLEEWLADAWAKYPQLKSECLALKTRQEFEASLNS